LLALHRCPCPSVQSPCSSFSATCGVSLQSLRLALHTCNWSIDTKPCFDLLHLAIWLHVMSHIQWAPSSHVWPLQTYPSHFYPHGSSCSH
jgi:hypothetical protein